MWTFLGGEGADTPSAPTLVRHCVYTFEMYLFGVGLFFWLNVEPCLRMELFKRSTGSGRHKRETGECMNRHHAWHYIIFFVSYSWINLMSQTMLSSICFSTKYSTENSYSVVKVPRKKWKHCCLGTMLVKLNSVLGTKLCQVVCLGWAMWCVPFHIRWWEKFLSGVFLAAQAVGLSSPIFDRVGNETYFPCPFGLVSAFRTTMAMPCGGVECRGRCPCQFGDYEL